MDHSCDPLEYERLNHLDQTATRWAASADCSRLLAEYRCNSWRRQFAIRLLTATFAFVAGESSMFF